MRFTLASKFLVALLLLLCWQLPAEARLSLAKPVVISACPAGDLLPDQCGQSALMQYGQQSSFQIGVSGIYASLPRCWALNGGINQISGSPTVYTTNPTSLATTGQGSNTVAYNSPGCEFGIGYFTPLSQLKDPTNPVITGCTYNATGGTSGSSGTMLCQGATLSHSISGYYFGATGSYAPGGSGAGHPCISVQFNANGLTGDYIWQNDFWDNNTGNCTYSSGVTAMFSTTQTQNITLHLWDSEINGNGLVYGDYFGPACEPSPGVAGNLCNPTSAANLSVIFPDQGGNIDIERTVFLNFVLRGLFWEQSCGANFTFESNWQQGDSSTDQASHGEFFQGEGPATNSCAFPGGVFFNYSNFINPTATAATGETIYGNFAVPGVNSVTQVDHSITIGAKAGGSVLTGTAPSISIAAGTSQVTFSSGGGWVVGSGVSVGDCTAAGVAGELGGTLRVPHSGSIVSAGPGGGYNAPAGSASTWGLDISNESPFIPYPLTGFIDDGSGHGSPSGVSGDVLTVTVTGLINLESDSVNGTVISGTNVPSGERVVTALSGATGGVGQYTVSIAANTGVAETISAQLPGSSVSLAQMFDGQWSAAVNITCPSGSVTNGPRTAMFMPTTLISWAAGPAPAGYPAPIIFTNNMTDEYGWGPSYGTFGWYQRGNGSPSTSVTPIGPATVPITGYIDDGLGGGSYDGVAGNTLTVTVGPANGWFVYANSTHGTDVSGTGVTTAMVTADGTGTGQTGTYTINGSAQAVASETMGINPAGCTGAAQFGGNLSMTGWYTYTQWNQWTATVPGSHC